MKGKWRESITIVMFGFLGLGFPDIDQLPGLFAILHHRSIVTHSIIIPAALLAIRNSAIRFSACGFILGISIHLAADVLSSPKGFGMIWLPWPIKIPLGWLSPAWLAINALVGMVWVKILLLRLKGWSPMTMYLITALSLGPCYAIIHEKSHLPFLSFVAIFGLSFALADWIANHPWFRRLP